MTRTEFGFTRLSCACEECKTNCRHMPGMIIPADLERLIPQGEDPFHWAMSNLLASKGAVVMQAGEIFRIPTLVPAVKPDGSCIHLNAGNCAIHVVSPYGCAFFDCSGGIDEREKVSLGLNAIRQAWIKRELYAQIWAHLAWYNRVQVDPVVLHQRIEAENKSRLISITSSHQ